jgi:hypothetical protein
MHPLILKLTRKSSRKCYLSAAMLLLLAGSERAQAQQSSSVAEKHAADTVALLVQQARQQGKLPELSRIEDPRLRADACARAKKESTSWQMGCGAFVSDAAVLSCFSFRPLIPASPSRNYCRGPCRTNDEIHAGLGWDLSWPFESRPSLSADGARQWWHQGPSRD